MTQQNHELIHELENDVAKLLDLKEENCSSVTELRDHLMEVYQKVGCNLLKKHQSYEE